MSVAALKNRAFLKNEEDASSFIPYGLHLTEHTVSTLDGNYVQVMRLDGASFDSADDKQLNNWHESLNSLLRGVAASTPNLAIWKHIVRREDKDYPRRQFPEGFAKDLDNKYAARVTGETLMVNELYLTIVYRPLANPLDKFVMRLMKNADQEAIKQERADSLDIIDKAAGELEQSLRRYDPQRIGIYERKRIHYSETFEFFGFLINDVWERVPLTRSNANKVLSTTRPYFGQESLAIRGAAHTTYGAMLGIKEYPAETHPGFLNALLAAPFPFVLTQSFTFINRTVAKKRLNRAQNVMNAVGDDAKSQIADIDDALDDLASNKWVMGEHHFSLLVKSADQKAVTDNLSIAKSILNDTGMIVAREDLAIEASFWAQLPGNFKYRPRIASITSRNFAGFSPLHNYPSGRAHNNHWGEPLTKFVTEAGTSFNFSYHASDPKEDDGGSKKDVGHTLLLGPSGSGKTAFVSFTLCALQAFGVTSVLLTKDRDTEVVIRALNGKYYRIKIGESTGWNPLWLEPTKSNIAFLIDFIKGLVKGLSEAELSVQDSDELIAAVNSVMRLDRPLRRLRRVLDFLDATRPDGNYAKLRQWCHAHKPGDEDGQHCWVFDNPEDTLIDSMGQALTTGFDTTEYLDVPALRGPINMWLFRLTNEMIDGRRFALFIAEFWKALDDPRLASFAKDGLKTIRKKNGFVVLDSQSPSDAINHPIGRTLIEQTPTKILFPNVEATYRDYASDEGLNLSEREYQLISQELQEGSRKFLIKQGHNSVVAKLDLKGFDFELSVLSARQHTLEFLDELLAVHGDDPAKWLPHFNNPLRRKA